MCIRDRLLATIIDIPDTMIKPKYNRIIFSFLNRLYKSGIKYLKIKYENDIKFKDDKTNICGTILSYELLKLYRV